MGKWYVFFRSMFKWASEDTGEFLTFIIWLIRAAIECGIVSFVVAVIAAKLFDKDFDEWFGGSLIVMAAIEIINGIILLFA